MRRVRPGKEGLMSQEENALRIQPSLSSHPALPLANPFPSLDLSVPTSVMSVPN